MRSPARSDAEVCFTPCRYAAPDAGFTLIEIVVATAIFLILIGLGLFIGLDFYRHAILDAERDTVVALLKKTRALALANDRGVPRGFFIDQDRYVIFAGTSFETRLPAFDEVVPRYPGIRATGISEVVFQPLSASSNASGTIALSDGARTVMIELNAEGRIN